MRAWLLSHTTTTKYSQIVERITINLYNGLKHSLGMHLLEKGVPKEMVQKIYGHSRPDMTDRYCEYQTKQMKVALESVVGEVVPFGEVQHNEMTGKS